jgi:predicted DCC family thiol-disulfide oxidoreductase YuxK
MSTAAPTVREPAFQRLVLFDGLCAVCDATVQWVLDHDPDGQFHFAPLQSDVAQEVLSRHPELPDDLDSIILVEVRPDGSEKAWTHSTAILRIAGRLEAPWSWLAAARIVPRPLRDLFYKAFARIRFKVFGRRDSCRMPEPRWADRFLGEA